MKFGMRKYEKEKRIAEGSWNDAFCFAILKDNKGSKRTQIHIAPGSVIVINCWKG